MQHQRKGISTWVLVAGETVKKSPVSKLRRRLKLGREGIPGAGEHGTQEADEERGMLSVWLDLGRPASGGGGPSTIEPAWRA